MKKAYIVPESKLFAIDLKENIAASDIIINGEDEISSSGRIKFTVDVTPCRGFYTGSDKPVNPNNSTFLDYYNELRGYNDFQAYFNCLSFAMDV